MVSKMKYFKNLVNNGADFYVYGEIVDEKEVDWWTGEVSKTAVDTLDFKNELDELEKNGVTDLNIYINSPGGSVFASSTIVSMLRRFKEKNGAKIHSFIDGLCASASTYLAMVADDINIYKNSIMMIHKPMTISIGNSIELQKDIDRLDMIEKNMMIPMYMEKSKVSEDEVKSLIGNETWFNGNVADENYIGNFFNANLIDEEKTVPMNFSKEMFRNYKNVPSILKNRVDDEHKKEEVKEVIDYSKYEKILKNFKEEK